MTLMQRERHHDRVIDLDGPDGNAFVLLGTARSLCKQLDMDPDPIIAEMMSGNYRKLVETFDKHFGRYFNIILPSNWESYE